MLVLRQVDNGFRLLSTWPWAIHINSVIVKYWLAFSTQSMEYFKSKTNVFVQCIDYH